MKKILILLISLLFIPLYFVDAASCENADGTFKSGSVSVSKNSITLTKGKSTTIKVTGSCAAGRIDIKSSDTSIVTVSPSSEFIDNGSVTITIKAKKAGSATVSIVLSDMGDYAGNVISGTKKVNVTVNEEVVTQKEETKPTTKNDTNTKEETIKEMKVNKFEIVGYNINFDINNYDYTIDISESVDKLYIIVAGENFKVSGDKEVDISNKDSIIVKLTNGNDVREYYIHLNKITKEIIKTETKEIEKEVVKMNNTYLYSTIGLGVLCLILLISLFSKKKVKTVEGPSVNSTPISGLKNPVSRFDNELGMEVVDLDLTTTIPTVNPNQNNNI